MSILDKNLEGIISGYYTNFLDKTFDNGQTALSIISDNDIAFVVNNAIPADKAIIYIKQLVDDYNNFKTGVDTRFEQQADGVATEIEQISHSVEDHLNETINQAIQSEASDRLADINQINQAIADEATARETKDEELSLAIESETSNRNVAINDEATARETKDEELSQSIAEETAVRETADEQINQAIADETNNRTIAIADAVNDAKNEVYGRLETFVAPRIDALENNVNNIQTNIANEQNIRTEVDTQLSAKIQELEEYKITANQTLARCFEKIQELENTVIALSAMITPTDIEIVLNYTDNTGNHTMQLQSNDTITWSTSTGNFSEYVKNINF